MLLVIVLVVTFPIGQARVMWAQIALSIALLLGPVFIPWRLSTGLRLPGDSSINTGMEWAGSVEARALTRFLWWTLHRTRDAAVAALLPCHSRKRGTAQVCRLAWARQGLQAAERSYGWKHPPDIGPPSLGVSVSACHPARRSAAGRSRVNALVPVLHLTRGAAEARMRRGRWSRGRATSWRTGRAGRGCVGGRCVRRWRGPAGWRRHDGVAAVAGDHPLRCGGGPVDAPGRRVHADPRLRRRQRPFRGVRAGWTDGRGGVRGGDVMAVMAEREFRGEMGRADARNAASPPRGRGVVAGGPGDGDGAGAPRGRRSRMGISLNVNTDSGERERWSERSDVARSVSSHRCRNGSSRSYSRPPDREYRRKCLWSVWAPSSATPLYVKNCIAPCRVGGSLRSRRE